MVWHIFKKDWKLIRGFVLVVAFLHWTAAFVRFRLGTSGEGEMLVMLAQVLPGLALFASMFLIAAIVHLEAIPGVRQDWLARPVPRGKLLVEKFLFVMVTVAGPIFAGNLVLGLLYGFSLWSSLLSTSSYVVYIIFLVVVPIFAFASVTKNMTQAFILGCGCAFIIAAAMTLVEALNGASHETLAAVTGSGVGWIGEAIRLMLAAAAAGIILGIQYFRRKTVAARAVVVAFGALLLTSQILPWNVAFAIEQRFTSKPEAAAGAMLKFDGTRGKYKSPSGAVPSSEKQSRGGMNDAEVFVPLEIAGVENDSILLTDRVDFRLQDLSGRLLYHGTGDNFEVTREGPSPSKSAVYQQIAIPGPTYRDVKDQEVELRVDYSLTVFSLLRSYALPAVRGSERMPKWGWCETQVNEGGTAVELHCIAQGKGPICGSVFLENASSGQRNPARTFCRSDYAPYRDQPLHDSFTRFGTNLPFHDPAGLAKFPVGGIQLEQSRVIVRVYEPAAHFMRSLRIPQIRLADWETLSSFDSSFLSVPAPQIR